jgi:hypothetical protein
MSLNNHLNDSVICARLFANILVAGPIVAVV